LTWNRLADFLGRCTVSTPVVLMILLVRKGTLIDASLVEAQAAPPEKGPPVRGRQGSPVQFGFHIQGVMGRVLTTAVNMYFR
jgi:hypothetical protein